MLASAQSTFADKCQQAGKFLISRKIRVAGFPQLLGDGFFQQRVAFAHGKIRRTGVNGGQQLAIVLIDQLQSFHQFAAYFLRANHRIQSAVVYPLADEKSDVNGTEEPLEIFQGILHG